jgi:hypothetical protein
VKRARGCEGTINYFMSIGMGVITEEMREYLEVSSPVTLRFQDVDYLYNLECPQVDYGTATSYA